eukprot:7645218-Heterocapsa_arctica.AAC.1
MFQPTLKTSRSQRVTAHAEATVLDASPPPPGMRTRLPTVERGIRQRRSQPKSSPQRGDTTYAND